MPPAGSPCVAVAFSGGRDSVALLHATCAAAAGLGLRVAALHVHHGLQPQADAWVEQIRALIAAWQARGWPVVLRWQRLEGRPGRGQSIEAWARTGRRRALMRMAHAEGASLLLLAQHRRDQAETVLLQLLRGGGPAGLAAMPELQRQGALLWARPWLQQPRDAIEAYGRLHRLPVIEDPSNADPRLARNRLRLQVWPALLAAWPHAEAPLAGSARLAAEAQALIDEVAAADLAACQDARGGLRIDDWRQRSPARQAWLLRAWWRAATGRGASEALIRRVLAEAPPGAPAGPADPAGPSGAACPRGLSEPLRPRAGRGLLQWPAEGGWRLQAWRGRLSLLQPPAVADDPVAHGPVGWPPLLQASAGSGRPGEGRSARRSRAPQVPASTLAARCRLEGWPGGILELRWADAGGLAPERLAGSVWRARSGGERFRLSPGGLARSLKKQFQARALPAPVREGPLLFGADGQLLWVPGLGVDAAQQASPGVPQLSLHWQPRAWQAHAGPT